ncbi:MAG: hypothetical protein AAGK66_08975 [Pseudomonadota bacterium]
MNRQAFYAALRKRDSGVFGTSLSQGQVETVEAILDAGSHLPLSHLAYALATAYGETGGRLRPIKENMNYSARRIPEVFKASRYKGYTLSQLAGNPKLLASVVYANRLGNGPPSSGDGFRYRGHGLVQLTGKSNFRKFGDRIGVDLVSNPERALELNIAVKALIAGIEHGLYTGKKASDYLPGSYYQARRIINGLFAAKEYAAYARAFDKALTVAGYRPQTVARDAEAPKPDPTPAPTSSKPPAARKTGLLAFLLSILRRKS